MRAAAAKSPEPGSWWIVDLDDGASVIAVTSEGEDFAKGWADGINRCHAALQGGSPGLDNKGDTTSGTERTA